MRAIAVLFALTACGAAPRRPSIATGPGTWVVRYAALHRGDHQTGSRPNA